MKARDHDALARRVQNLGRGSVRWPVAKRLTRLVKRAIAAELADKGVLRLQGLGTLRVLNTTPPTVDMRASASLKRKLKMAAENRAKGLPGVPMKPFKPMSIAYQKRAVNAAFHVIDWCERMEETAQFATQYGKADNRPSARSKELELLQEVFRIMARGEAPVFP